KRERQPAMWVTTTEFPTAAGHPFYSRLNQLLCEHGFDDFAENQCVTFYAETMGRPSLPPGIYFRLLLIGLLRGHRLGTRDRVARGGFVRVAGLLGRRSGGRAAGPLDDFAHASVDRSRNASGRLYVGAAVPEHGGPGQRE